MKRAAVINLSHPHYNLGCAKLSAWLRSEGYDVTETEAPPALLLRGLDLVCFSAIFSWDVIRGADLARGLEGEVWAGGPGFQHMSDYWYRETGRTAVFGLDARFEFQRGPFRMVYAARGCPLNCHFCGVHTWEGREYRLDYQFGPAPILMDNNLTDEPVEFQEFVVRRYQETGVRLLDASSGFEPTHFNEETYERWRPILRGPWRCGYDYLPEWRHVKRFMKILEPVKDRRKKRIYVLAGNEPFDVCLQRVNEVLEWGGEPHVQGLLRKDAKHRHDFELRYDWTTLKLTHFARYFNRRGWKASPLEEYRCRSLQPFRVLTA